MQELFNYVVNDIKYICYIKDNQVIFGKINDNNFDTDLNEEELKQIISVYMFLVNNQKDSVRIKDIKLQDTTFEVYYNSSNDLYTFKQKDHLDKKNYLPILNNAFNNRGDKLYSKNERLSKFIKISLLVGVAVTTVNVSAFFNTNSIPTTFKDFDDFEKGYEVSSVFREEIENYDNTDYKWEDIKNVIDNNPNLTNKEKEFLYGFRHLIEDNLEFIDIPIIKRNLSELKFVYHPYEEKEYDYDYDYENGDEEDKKEDIVVRGTYTNMGSNRNQIDFYGTRQYTAQSFNSIAKTTGEHEVGHALTKYSIGYTYPGVYGDIKYALYYLNDKHFDKLAEGINELFAREYSNVTTLREKSAAYAYLMPVMYTLCEVLDDDVLRCYRFNCNLYYVTNALNKLGIPLEDIHDFYNAINIFVTAHGDDEEERNDLLAYQSARKAYHYLNEFYYTKYGKNIEDDLSLSASFYHTMYVSDDYSENLENQLGMFDITYTPRYYFNSDKIEKENIPKVTGIDEYGHGKVVELDGKYYLNTDDVVK